MNARDVEICVAEFFGYRRNIIVPNVWWGLGLNYEADMVGLRKSGFAVEVEIKVSAADIKADLKKLHNHDSNLFRELWFAVPDSLKDHSDIPDRAGILAVQTYRTKRNTKKYYIKNKYRNPKPNQKAKCWDDKQRLKLLHLGVMRIWTLKKHLNNNNR